MQAPVKYRYAPAVREIEIRSAENLLYLTETDQTDPTGRWRLRLDGDKVYLERATGANWATDEDWIIFDKAGTLVDFNTYGVQTAANIAFKSGTANVVTLDHAATGARTITVPDATDTMCVLAASQALTTKTYDGLTIATGTNTFTLTRGTGSLDVAAGKVVNIDQNLTVNTAAVTLNQSLQTTDSPTFDVLSLSATSNQIVLQSAGVTGTITWTPTSSGKTLTIPDATDTVCVLAASQALTTKTYDGLTIATGTNTFTLTRGTGSLDVAAGKVVDINMNLTVNTANVTLNQSLQTSDSPTFNVLSLSGTSNQIVLQSAGVTGTITWTPTTAGKTLTIPDATDTVCVLAASQALTTKTYDGLTIATGTNTFTLTRGTGSLDVAAGKVVDIDQNLTVNTAAVTLNQSLQTSDSPTFNVLSLSGTSNQIVLQSAGVTGTITWTPTTAGKTLTIPDATDTMCLLAASQTLTNKTLTAPSIGGITSLAEAAEILWGDETLATANSTYSGFVTTETAGENLAFPDLVYFKSDGKFWKTDADAVGTTEGRLALAVATINASASGKLLQRGFIRYDTWNWTVGGTIYVDVTAGAMSQTAPSGSGDQVRKVGYAVSADVMYFDPDSTIVEIT